MSQPMTHDACGAGGCSDTSCTSGDKVGKCLQSGPFARARSN